MKIFYTLFLAIGFISLVCAMELPEKPLVKQFAKEELTLEIEGTSYALELLYLWDHISHCMVKEKKNSEKGLAIHGFHHYGDKSYKIEDCDEGKLVKIDDSVWVYLPEANINSFHAGVVFCEGVCSTKTFFPVDWSKKAILECITKAAASASCYDKKTHDWGREYICEAPIQENVKLRFVLCSDLITNKMRIVSVYPVLLKNRDASEEALKKIAKMRLNTIVMARVAPKALPPASLEVQKLMSAAKKGDLEELIKLHESGIDLTALDQHGNSALHHAIGSRDYLSVLFLINDKLINRANNEGVTPLVKAIAIKDTGILGLLITYGADVKSADCRNQTPLMHVVRLLQQDSHAAVILAGVLLRAGADVNMKDRRGTALMHALEYEHAERLVHSLLDFDADYTTLKNDKDKTALQLESIKKRQYIKTWIAQKEAWKQTHQATEFEYRVQSGHRMHVQLQISNQKPSLGELNSALIYAAKNKDEAMVRLLVPEGADPRQIVSFFEKCSKSLQELFEKRIEQIALAEKAEREKKNQQFKQAYDRFFEHFKWEKLDSWDLEALHMFKEHKVTKDGCTPFLYAVRDRKLAIVGQMLKHGLVNTHAIDARGRTALTIAYDNDDSEMFGLLLTDNSLLEKQMFAFFQRVLQEGKVNFLGLFVHRHLNVVIAAFKQALRADDFDRLKILKSHIPFLDDQAKLLAFDALNTEEVAYLKNLIKEYPTTLHAKNEKGQSLLTAAAERSRDDLVKALDELGVEKQDLSGKTAIMYAAGDAKLRIEKYYETKEASLKIQEKEKEKKRLLALKYPIYSIWAYFDEEEEILACDSTDAAKDINAVTPEGDSPLHIAVKAEKIKALRALCKKGASLTSVDARGNTPLLSALHQGLFDFAKELLWAGAPVLTACKGALERYFTNKDIPTDVIRVMENKVQEEVRSILKEVEKHLQQDAAYLPDESVKKCIGYIPQEKKLFEARCLLKDKNLQAIPLIKIMFASELASGKNVSMLLNDAVFYGNQKLVEFLIESGCDVNGLDGCGRTPLLAACIQKDKALIDYLLQRGANPFMSGIQGFYPFDVSLRNDSACLRVFIRGIVNYCYSQQEKQLPASKTYLPNFEEKNILLYIASRLGEPTLVEVLLKEGARAEFQSKNGLTPLLAVLQHAGKENPCDRKRVVELLLRYNGNIETGCNGLTPLLYCVSTNEIDMVEFLLSKGANVNYFHPKENDTALHFAAMAGNIEMLELLLKAGAKLESENAAGFTALVTAIIYNKMRAAEFLVNKGANVAISIIEDCPLSLAIRAADIDLVKVLVAKGAPVDETYYAGMTCLSLASSLYSKTQAPRLKEILDFLRAAKNQN